MAKKKAKESEIPFEMVESTIPSTENKNGLYEEIPTSFNTIMQNGLSGNFFGGADLPGFQGDPTE